jgi:flavin-dependent dehydrogenase
MGHRVLVIGGGVAGSSCALRLRSRGIDVHVAEKLSFPRAKVCGCCIGGVGLNLLETLSLRSWAEAHGVPTSTWIGSMGGTRIELSLPDGVAISRESLDSEMLRRAAEAGAEVSSPVSARVDQLHSDSVTASLSAAEGTSWIERYAAVVIASGLNASGSQRLLPWVEKPNGPFGAAFFARSDSLAAGTIYMACDDDGYVGLVRLEDGRVDIAAALSSLRSRDLKPPDSEAHGAGTYNPGAHGAGGPGGFGSAKDRIDRILMRSRLPNWQYHDPTPVMTTPPLRRLRRPGIGRLIAIGDAAGYVEPFTGEGMTWGILSGIAAADLIADSGKDLSGLGDRWSEQLPALLRKRRLACRAVTNLLRYPLGRRAIAATLSQWPGLAAPLIRHLNRT